MKLAIGKRFMTRAGATVEVVQRIDTGLTVYRASDMKGLGKAYLIVCHIVRYADGSPADPDNPRKIVVHDDGFYLSHADHELDLVAEVQELASVA